MSYQNVENVMRNLCVHLAKKGYTEIRPQDPLDHAFLQQTFLGTIPKVIGMIDATKSTNTPGVTYNSVKGWFLQLLGNSGAGVLLFIYQQPEAVFVDEILKLGDTILGKGQIVAGAYDIFSNSYWLPKDPMGFAAHMGWDQEIFG